MIKHRISFVVFAFCALNSLRGEESSTSDLFGDDFFGFKQERSSDSSPAALEQEQIKDRYGDKLESAYQQYKHDTARLLRHADRISIYLLDADISPDNRSKSFTVDLDDSLFPIKPYDTCTPILGATNVTEKTIIESFVSNFKILLNDEEHNFVTLCHYPTHGVRVYAGQSLLFESSFSWKCSNYSFEDRWEHISDDSTEKLFKNVMPITEDQINRIKRKSSDNH